MDNVLFKYFEERYKEAQKKETKMPEFGPVITLSRQTGCEAKKVGSRLVKALNELNPHKKWHCIDKELLEKSAKELNMGESMIEHFYEGQEKSAFIDMFVGFSKSYINDIKIKNTIKEVMVDLCKHGNVVLVGRAGAAILQDFPQTLNIRLTAPFMWRIDTLMKNRGKSMEECEEWAIDTDEKRYKLFYEFLEKRPGNLDYLFDAILNRRNYSVDDIVALILKLSKVRGII